MQFERSVTMADACAACPMHRPGRIRDVHIPVSGVGPARKERYLVVLADTSTRVVRGCGCVLADTPLWDDAASSRILASRSCGPGCGRRSCPCCDRFPLAILGRLQT